jgi:hypothetical protein
MDGLNPRGTSSLELVWSPVYQPQWDDQPEAYVRHGMVAWGRSRRLVRAADMQCSFKSYIGIQHYDPSRWHTAGEPRTVFFLSLFVHGRTVALRTFPTCQDALAAMRVFHSSLLTKFQE